MLIRNFFFIILIILNSCSKEEVRYQLKEKVSPYSVYKEAHSALEKGDFFFAQKKFSEAELNFDIVEYAAKSSIMASYCLYSIRFYTEAIENLNKYLKKYPADKNVIYAHYLIALIYFEQITDEKKDIDPVLNAKDKIEFFLKEFPNNDYAIDLEFKKDLIINQLAAKELYVAKYYIATQKWIPAINRLKIIVNDYDQTVFVEEALHRLVEIYFYLGLEEKSKKYAKLLGYNYNSGEWFKQSYKILNKDYKIKNLSKSKKEKGFIEKILNKIR